MLDIHCHILPYTDDGATDINASLDMAKKAEKLGYDGVFATSHYIIHDNEIENKTFINNIKKLNEMFEIENINVKVYEGNEIFFTNDIVKLIKEKKVSTLANSRYVLVELPLFNSIIPMNVYDEFNKLQDAGFTIDSEVEEEVTDELEPGLVYKTEPPAGVIRKKGTSIKLIIAKDKEAIVVEDYKGKNYLEVKAVLEEKGIYVLVEKKEVEDKDSAEENIIIDPQTREIDFNDGSITENTRAGYPVDYIENAQIPGIGGIPKVVIFLTADAFGVLPPISKLDKQAAMYHFVTGFTSKLAGTERGITEPQPTFSTLFGEPFMPMDASVYAKMLGEKLEKYGTKVYLVNTGWTGGSAASGAKRIKLEYTRAMVTAALNGWLDNVEFKHHDIFNVYYPLSCPGVPNGNLDAREMWADKSAYDKQANKLAQMFVDNFAAKYPDMPEEIVEAGPKPKN